MNKISKKLCLLLALMMAFTMFAAGCGSSGDKTGATDSSLTDLVAKGTFVIGVDDEFAPMGFRDEAGNLTGFDVELAKLVAAKLGVGFEAQAIDWSTKEVLLDNGTIDAIWNGYTITAERNDKVEYTKPYMNNQQVIVVAADSPVATKADLVGKVVGAQSDSSGLAALQADDVLATGAASILEYDTYQTALLDLTTSRVDAIVIDKIYIQYAMAKSPGTYKLLDETLGDELYGIGVKKGSVALREAIDTALDELQQDGSIDKLSAAWFGENIVIRDMEKQTAADLK